MIRLATLAAIVAIALLAVPSPRAQNTAPQGEKSAAAPAGNAETGKKIFTKDGCYECHGREGQGAAQGAGPRIGPPLLSFEAFTKYVHQPTGQMPPYTSKVISDQDLADIYRLLAIETEGHALQGYSAAQSIEAGHELIFGSFSFWKSVVCGRAIGASVSLANRVSMKIPYSGKRCRLNPSMQHPVTN